MIRRAEINQRGGEDRQTSVGEDLREQKPAFRGGNTI